MKIAFIGLGVMGFPMAGHLANTGHDVTVFNRTTEKALLWVKTYPGSTASTPADAANGCDMVFICVGNDDDLLFNGQFTGGKCYGLIRRILQRQ